MTSEMIRLLELSALLSQEAHQLANRDNALRAIIDCDEEYNHLPFEDLIRELIDRAIKYRAGRHNAVSALELIRDNGGKTTDCELGISCNGTWCAEQARRALEEIANTSLSGAETAAGKDR